MNNKLEKLNSLSPAKAVLTNALPSMISMIMVLVYNMADLFFVGQTGNPLQVAAVSIATPIFIIFMSCGNIVNIVLDPVFILGFDLGVTGAAIATVIGNICGALYYVFLYPKWQNFT